MSSISPFTVASRPTLVGLQTPTPPKSVDYVARLQNISDEVDGILSKTEESKKRVDRNEFANVGEMKSLLKWVTSTSDLLSKYQLEVSEMDEKIPEDQRGKISRVMNLIGLSLSLLGVCSSRLQRMIEEKS